MLPPSPEAAALAARAIRILTVDAVSRARSGHVGLPLGCAEIGVTLFSEFLRHDPSDTGWPDRDRFVLSAGHGSMLLYALLHLSGYELARDALERFRQLGSITPGHPERGLTPGVEVTSGPLGQGFANAVGMALAERILAARFSPDLVDHRTFVLASDGDLMEGLASEAASLAGHLGLGRLIVIYDDNGVTIDAPTSATFSEDVPARFEAYGWQVQKIDGHDPEAVRDALRTASGSEERPHLIAAKTHIGLGTPMVDTPPAHGAINAEQTEQTRATLGWTAPPFEIPDAVREVFRPNAERGAEERRAWRERLERTLTDADLARSWRAMLDGRLPDDLDALLPRFEPPDRVETRRASGAVLNALAAAVPSLIGGSADLAGSTSTTLTDAGWIERGKFDGRNVSYGVREHAMAGIASGMALHGGIRPYIGTFLVFSDYMRPAMRLAAIMGLRVTYVFSHDSIFVGEDGPTHQPVEQLAGLRSVPNLWVWRPADARETVVAWRTVLECERGPCALLLTRQKVAVLDPEGVEEGARRGGYVLLRERADLELVIVASGSEVEPALAAGRALAGEGRGVRVVSMPCLEQFLDCDAAYRREVLPDAAPRLVVEAGVEQGAALLLRTQDRFHGMSGFGSSAPYTDLAEHFGFSEAHVVRSARELLG